MTHSSAELPADLPPNWDWQLDTTAVTPWLLEDVQGDEGMWLMLWYLAKEHPQPGILLESRVPNGQRLFEFRPLAELSPGDRLEISAAMTQLPGYTAWPNSCYRLIATQVPQWRVTQISIQSLKQHAAAALLSLQRQTSRAGN
ncbi:MAG: hypothetical protein AAGF24_11555 [Cyanobacteria bacterium P01_H01_bin.121]